MVDKFRKNLKWYERFTYTVITHTELFFYNLGKKIGLHPKRTIAICLLSVILSAFGLLRFHQEKNPMRLWVPINSQFYTDSEWLMNTFETAYRIESMIIEADNVLTPKIFNQILEIDEYVKNSVTPTGLHYRDVCFLVPELDSNLMELMSDKKSKDCENNKTCVEFDPSASLNAGTYCNLVEAMGKDCFGKSILGLWDNNPRRIKKLTTEEILYKVNTVKVDPILGNLRNYRSLLGGLITNETGHIVGAKALATFWMTNLNFTAVDMEKIGNHAGTTEWASLECLEWENEFIKIMETLQNRFTDFKLFYSAGRSFGDISGETMFQGFDILIIGSFVMITYVIFVISKLNCVETRVMLGFVGLFSVGFAVLAAAGLCSLFGVSYGPVHTSLPFLLMGLGVDDMFVIVACWEKLTIEQKRLPMNERIGFMMQHAGVSITVTTATDVLAFIVGATTILPCLRSYCLYAAAGVFLTFVYVITFFVACFVLDQKRVEKNISGILPWKRYENYKPNKFSHSECSSKVFHFIYSKIILTWPGKLLVILITLSCLGFSIESIFKLEQKFDPFWFVPKYTYLGQYNEKKSEYFPLFGFEAGTYIGAINYTAEFNKIRAVDLELENSTNIIIDISSWVDPFRNYVKTYFSADLYKEEISPNEFNLYLSKFLFSPKGARFQANFKFEKPLECGIPASKILISSIDYNFKLFHGPHEHIPAMRRIMNISKYANFTTGEQTTTGWSKIFATWITDEVIDVEVIRNIELALIAVMTCTSLLIANVQICFWVFICIVLSMINVCGFMQKWGLSIDIVSCIALQLAIGLCVDYATHIGHTFLRIEEGSRNERVLKTVTTIGSAVVYGGLSTLIGVSMLGFSDSYNFQTFFKIFMLVVIFGLYHGIILLPVILSWIGPKPYYTHRIVEQSDIIDKNESTV